ncbi:carbon-nitrogen hydrolase family protein [bacterium]|nr:carbon-nitrogen hydrolase family protein [bacterium]
MPRLAVAQTALTPGDPPANLDQALALIHRAAGAGAELVCLPECLNTGLPGDRLPELAETVPGPFTEALAGAAQQGGLWVVSGMAERRGDRLHNAAVIIGPDGTLRAVYRKCYLYLGEAEAFTPGTQACVMDMGFATAGVAVCYDYVFPEYIRRLRLAGAQLLLHPTAWVDTEACRRWRYPATEAYRAQCRVRALENGLYVASANHWGPYDASGALQCVGHSSIIAPWGEVLAEVAEGAGVAVADVDFARAAEWAATAAPYVRDFQQVPCPGLEGDEP